MIGRDARAVANFILDEADSIGIWLSNLALQKILYFAHGWSLVLHRRPLVRQSFEAWEHGPVIRDVYGAFKNHGSKPITKTRAVIFDVSTRSECIAKEYFEKQEEFLILDNLKYYGRINAFKLSTMTHTTGGPWDIVWSKKTEANIGMKISDQSILDFFMELKSKGNSH